MVTLLLTTLNPSGMKNKHNYRNYLVRNRWLIGFEVKLFLTAFAIQLHF